jgi:hypothetical protein
MRRPACLFALLALLAAAAPARAEVLINVDKNAQTMTVTVDGERRYVWPVATGISRYDTPDGEFTPFRMEKDHFSREWDDAPMPYSIFFTKQGHAIHGTNHRIDGAPASHGCVRLSVKHAATLWKLVKAEGMQNVRVELAGKIPTRAELMARRKADDEPKVTGSIGSAAQDRTNLAAREPDAAAGDIAALPAPAPDGFDDPRELPRVGHGWAEYHEGGRTYYYRVSPREVRRVVPRGYRVYRYGPRYVYPW